jgi:hypothetical protein
MGYETYRELVFECQKKRPEKTAASVREIPLVARHERRDPAYHP